MSRKIKKDPKPNGQNGTYFLRTYLKISESLNRRSQISVCIIDMEVFKLLVPAVGISFLNSAYAMPVLCLYSVSVLPFIAEFLL
jgi:hypothetical protein